MQMTVGVADGEHRELAVLDVVPQCLAGRMCGRCHWKYPLWPLVSHEVFVNLIANTSTRAGLKIRAELDRGKYPTGIKITDAELASLNLQPASFHGEWNFVLLPTKKKS